MSGPVLVIQPRRLGDLILAFPLLLRLHNLDPGRPIWLAGQPGFFTPLLPLAPKVTFFPVAALPELARHNFSTIINLGNDAASALATASASAQRKLGPLQTGDGLFINGYWQLYRESLTQNNRHNPFHWADLFSLDFGLPVLRLPGAKPAGRGRIGIFTGASEASKRPEPAFWARLATQLARRGYKPVLLGGPSEAGTGAEIIARGAKAANFCGKTDLSQLAILLKSLDLLITPDTGPMHLADWLGVPVLNLSMGNVSAAETGPTRPGQRILRAAMSCAGCWQCSRGSLACHNAFLPEPVAGFAADLASGATPEAPPGLELLTSSRDDLSLYRLSGQKPLREKLESFWQAAFLYFDSPSFEQRARDAAASLAGESPQITAAMRATLAKMLEKLAAANKRAEPLPSDFWRNQPWHSRLFAGYLQTSLQNSGFAKNAIARVLTEIDFLQATLSA